MRGVSCETRPCSQWTTLKTQQVESLRNHGYALLSEFFPSDSSVAFLQKLTKCFAIFKSIWDERTPFKRARAGVFKDFLYELAATEKMIALRDPLIHIPELLGVAFHESILKIAANFLGYVPPLYRATVVRDFPHNRALHSSNFHKDNDESDSLQIFIYLVDIDDTCGPLIYIPGIESLRRPLMQAPPFARSRFASNDGRLSDEEVERIYPRNSWAVLTTARGSIAAIHGNGIHKGPAWTRPGRPE